MTVLLMTALRTSVIIAVGLLACMAARRWSAAWRHALLTAALGSAILAIPVSLVVPAWTVSLPVDNPPVSVSQAPASPPAASIVSHDTAAGTSAIERSNTFDLESVLLWIWGAGCLVGVLRLIAGGVRLAQLTRHAVSVSAGPWADQVPGLSEGFGIRRPVVLLVTHSRDTLATWGLRRPQILLPPDALSWDRTRMRIVLCHELAHIARGDWLIQITGDVLKAALWFTPLTWMLCSRLRRESEQACDDRVLAQGVSPRDYAEQIIEIAATRRQTPALASALSIARPSGLEERITAMLNPTLDRQPLSRRSRLVLVAALLVVTGPAAALRVAAQPGPLNLAVQLFDSTGGVLPGASIALEHAETATRSAVTDGSGHVSFDAVPPGDYTLEASVVGFKSLRTPFTLRATRDWQRTVTLQVGDLMETVSVAVPRRPLAAAGAAAPEPLRVGGNIKAPRKLNHVPPEYPQAMADAGLEGLVPVEAVIGKDGSVTAVRVVSAQMHPEFARAAENAVREWKFSPTLLNGDAVEVRMTVSVRFSLTD
jgi:TonB family protein